MPACSQDGFANKKIEVNALMANFSWRYAPVSIFKGACRICMELLHCLDNAQTSARISLRYNSYKKETKPWI
jgi:hypothetical protein